MPGDQSFFLLNRSFSRPEFFGKTMDPGAFDLMFLATRGEAVPDSPIRIAHDMGRVPGDFVWVSLHPLVHQRIVDALTEAGLTGWSTYPVELFGRQGEAVPGYYGLAVTGRCGALLNDREHSELVYRELPGGRFPYYRGLHVDGWDESDFFMTAGRGHIVITEKAAKILANSNVELQPISEFEYGADDQPAYPRLRPPETAHPPANLTVLTLTDEERAEVAELALHGRSQLGVSDAETVDQVTARMMQYVEEVRPLDGDALVERAMELGCLWGKLVTEAAGWEWVALQEPDGDGMRYAVVDSERAYAVEPVTYFHELLSSDERHNNVLLLFNMIVAGRLPEAESHALLTLG